MIILGASLLGTTLTLATHVQCTVCKRATLVITHDPLKPGFRCSCCAGKS